MLKKSNVYRKTHTSGTVDLGTVVTDVSDKQDTLVSGENIKTVNSNSLVGAGNVTLEELVGFTPVQQGGGTDMGGNKLYLGWDGSDLLLQVDTSQIGKLATQSYVNTMKEEIEGELVITENTQFNVSGVKFKLVKK